MSKLRIHGFAISLDGYGAVPNQDLDNPLGVGGRALHVIRPGEAPVAARTGSGLLCRLFALGYADPANAELESHRTIAG